MLSFSFPIFPLQNYTNLWLILCPTRLKSLEGYKSISNRNSILFSTLNLNDRYHYPLFCSQYQVHSNYHLLILQTHFPHLFIMKTLTYHNLSLIFSSTQFITVTHTPLSALATSEHLAGKLPTIAWRQTTIIIHQTRYTLINSRSRNDS